MAAFQQHLTAEPPSLVIIRRELDRLMREQPFPSERTADVRLAVTEACTNVVMHAYPSDEPGPLLVTADLCSESLVVTVRDYGCGLPAHRLGVGLGGTLIQALADTVDATNADPGVALRLEFHI